EDVERSILPLRIQRLQHLIDIAKGTDEQAQLARDALSLIEQDGSLAGPDRLKVEMRVKDGMIEIPNGNLQLLAAKGLAEIAKNSAIDMTRSISIGMRNPNGAIRLALYPAAKSLIMKADAEAAASAYKDLLKREIVRPPSEQSAPLQIALL